METEVLKNIFKVMGEIQILGTLKETWYLMDTIGVKDNLKRGVRNVQLQNPFVKVSATTRVFFHTENAMLK